MTEHQRQVDKSHYEFSRYMTKPRWISIWHQIDEVQQLHPERVLEIGPGPGLFKTVATLFDICVETLDLDPELKPDHVASVTSMPFPDAAYDVVCAFQMLEHLPYDVSLKAFKEMVRVSQRYILISLPDARPVWRYHLHIPKLGPCDFLIPRPYFAAAIHRFDGEHYWEVNKRDYSFFRVIADFSEHIQLIKTFRVPENPSHRFFVFKR